MISLSSNPDTPTIIFFITWPARSADYLQCPRIITTVCVIFLILHCIFHAGQKKKKNTGKILGYHFLAISSSFFSWERALIPHYTRPLHQTDFCQVVQTTRVQGLNPAGTKSCRKLSRMSKKLVRFFVCVCVCEVLSHYGLAV